MKNNYLFAGASSLIAIQTAKILQNNGHSVMALSTKEKNHDYDTFIKVESYDRADLPSIQETIHGLVYFPGTINLKPFQRISSAEFQTDFEINALGAVHCVQTYLPNLKKSPGGSVVFMSSVAVQTGMAFHTSIAMAKGAIEGLTKALAAELAPVIRVNAIAPSLTATPLSEKFTNTPEKLDFSQSRNPLKKIGSADEIAEAVSFLLSSRSSWITGQIIAVDGGMGTLK